MGDRGLPEALHEAQVEDAEEDAPQASQNGVADGEYLHRRGTHSSGPISEGIGISDGA